MRQMYEKAGEYQLPMATSIREVNHPNVATAASAHGENIREMQRISGYGPRSSNSRGPTTQDVHGGFAPQSLPPNVPAMSQLSSAPSRGIGSTGFHGGSMFPGGLTNLGMRGVETWRLRRKTPGLGRH